jgi:hypothetical protein
MSLTKSQEVDLHGDLLKMLDGVEESKLGGYLIFKNREEYVDIVEKMADHAMRVRRDAELDAREILERLRPRSNAA